ncbi:MAG TPA: DNA polymerase Y family protein [Stellaceae bacterium]
MIDAAGRRLLAAINPAAAAAGLAPGMPLADALSFLPGLATASAEPAADAAALRRLAEWCGRYSPWTAPDGADGVRIEITGSAHLWGGEAVLAADLAARLDRQGAAGRIAVADTLGAAWALARFAPAGERAVILPAGEMRAGLAALPIEALRLDPATAQGLRRVGLKQIGDLYAMPRSALARRFGEGVARRLDQAQGDLPEPLSPLGEAPIRRVRLSFAEPIADPADLARAAERLALDLAGRLAREGMGARRLDLTFYRIDGRVERIVVGTARPSRDQHHLAALFKERLDTVDPGLGIEDAILAAFAVEPLAPEQIGLLRHEPPLVCREHPSLVIPAKAGSQERPAPLPGLLGPRFRGGDGKPRGTRPGAKGTTEGMAPLLDRLSNRLGLDALSRIEAHASHIPECASVKVPAELPSPPSQRSGPSPAMRERGDPARRDGWVRGRRGEEGLKPLRPIRLFEPPEPIAAAWLLPDDPPFRFTWRRRAHRVTRADGPERIAEEWWRPSASDAGPRESGDAIRDYYRVEDEDGRRFWLFRAGLAGGDPRPRWYLHGLFA